MTPPAPGRITRIGLSRFKNFERAELRLGPFTLLIGANASGKSNVRDAFRFLHGIARRYTLAEIIGEKYGEGGVLQWRGIRGGTREVAFMGSPTFEIDAELTVRYGEQDREARYHIEVDVGDSARGPWVAAELLAIDGRQVLPQLRRHASQPLLTDAPNVETAPVIQSLASMRFLDLSPDAMRMPSLPGQLVLGDRGENLSSVLQAIVADPAQKEALLDWLRELTPMDASDFRFPQDQTGRILVSLVERDGREVSAYSASDGTLRFLAMIAALMRPESAHLYFFEELENGIHPARLHLLLQLIERQVATGAVQVVATSHSPWLLGLTQPATLDDAALVYRLPGRRDAEIKKIGDLPNAREVLERQDVARLHGSGWFEDVADFLEEDPGNG
jgi:predicted ATPase